MANDYPRSYRVADQIQRELSELIRLEVKDPGVSKMLTISSVDVSRDLSIARVYYTLFDEEELKTTQKGLTRSSGYLRRCLSRSLTLRSVPELRFIYDDSIAQGNKMSALIDNAVRSNSTAADSDDPVVQSTSDQDASSAASPGDENT